MSTRVCRKTDQGMARHHASAGLTLVEVMVASVIAGIGMAGGFAMVQWAEHGRVFGAQGTRALALVTSKLEEMRATPWERLVAEAGSGRGGAVPPLREDGAGADRIAGDGTISAAELVDGMQLVWSIEPSRVGNVNQSGYVFIRAAVRYRLPLGGVREVAVGTIRGNPRFVGGA